MDSNDPELFRQARVLHDLIQEHGTVSFEPKLLAERVRRLQAGLPSEDEFACLAWWSGRCQLIHPMGQDVPSTQPAKDYLIPDFLLITEHLGRSTTVLVEVKTQAIDFSKEVQRNYLQLGGSQYKRLTKYRHATQLPVLIAWKAEPMGWILVDLEEFQVVKTAYRLTLDVAMKQNLMGLMLGDFSVSFEKGASFVMQLRRMSKGRKRFQAQIADIYFQNVRGERVTRIEGPFVDLFGLGSDEVNQTEDGALITQSFEKTGEDIFPVQRLLPLAIRGWDKETHTWKQALGSGFSYRLGDVRRAAEDGLNKGLVRYILDVEPHDVPAFLSVGQYDRVTKTNGGGRGSGRSS